VLRINQQGDFSSCGYRVCLIVESYLQYGTTYIRNLNINREIDRINNIIINLWDSSTYPPYYPPQRDQAASPRIARDSDEEEIENQPSAGIITTLI
jgi:hypothetical protein